MATNPNLTTFKLNFELPFKFLFQISPKSRKPLKLSTAMHETFGIFRFISHEGNTSFIDFNQWVEDHCNSSLTSSQNLEIQVAIWVWHSDQQRQKTKIFWRRIWKLHLIQWNQKRIDKYIYKVLNSYATNKFYMMVVILVSYTSDVKWGTIHGEQNLM